MSRPSKGELFVEKLTANENIAIGIIFNANTGGSNIIRGFVTDDTLSFGTRANYQDLLDMNMADAAEALTSGGVGAVLGSTLGGLAGKATKFAARATGLSGAKFVQQTILSWEGSERPQFTVGMKFVAIRPTDDPRIPAMNLMRRCMPTQGNNSILGGASSALNSLNGMGDFNISSGVIDKVGGFIGATSENLLTAPNGYRSVLGALQAGQFTRSTSESGVEGTCTVTIGKWFRALNQILLSADFDISRATLPSGVPLYAEGKITFEPYRMITDEEFDSYFPVIANTSDTVYTT
jgi:hypothetical protein